MSQDQTPRSLMRSFQAATPGDTQKQASNAAAKDAMRGFINTSKQLPPDFAHQKLLNSPQLSNFHPYIEDQVIRIQSDGEVLLPGVQATPPIKKTNHEVSAFPSIQSNPSDAMHPSLPHTPDSYSSHASPILANPNSTPISNANTVAGVAFFNPSRSSEAQQKSSLQKVNTSIRTEDNDTSTLSHVSSISGITPLKSSEKSSNKAYDQLLSSPALRGLSIEVVDQVLHIRTPHEADSSGHSQTSRSLFDLSPSPKSTTRRAVDGATSLPSIVGRSPKAVSFNPNLPSSQNAGADSHQTPAKNTSSNPASASKEKGLADLLAREKSIEMEAKRKSPRVQDSPIPPSPRVRKEVPVRRVRNIHRIDSLQVKSTRHFSLLDYVLFLMNIAVFLAILISLLVLLQVLSVTHKETLEEVVSWTISTFNENEYSNALLTYGRENFPFLFEQSI